MDNLKLPAYPRLVWETMNDGQIVYEQSHGFTKLEKAALMIAQGLSSHGYFDTGSSESLAQDSVRIAKEVLKECNK